MENHDEQYSQTARETDLSKAQNPQQPLDRQNQAQGSVGQSQEQPQGQADYGSAGQIEGESGSRSQQRAEIDGGTGQASDVEGSAQFVGSKSASDTSSEFIEDDESSDFARDGQGAAE